ncbi:2-succinyl-5-enolpyruvyl-6-hydroxy-3-cyclohexene-1-carboxylic-acid synthase [Saxibacter everestensis]|uniref:2-succinyl-5-enolpyruvyl-6-hydroxy-3-cyclohexene-1-carboxylate synthase n=1 Tax=Saxibacter everestensis TaxID=2909229 RepID=A0ABY8QRA1_9MICO|nr:2-succinyl-5-enolpyruvyl-6-hydroxy-3-cyclohexene-1-carboxylic-acid synthase [Brevibacteriaceae bacterium ZFBP1038]
MNPSTASAQLVVQSLIAHGVRHVVLAPGSRSAPLAYALVAAADAGELTLHVRIDERVAGFTALGLARGSRYPAAVVTTSGTAVANLHPAVLEASYGSVPMIVLSADRPAELRGTGSNQTMRAQHEMFGSEVRFLADLPAPDSPERLAEWSKGLCAAIAAARGLGSTSQAGRRPGPVQLNLAFRDPLVPDSTDAEGPAAAGSASASGEHWARAASELAGHPTGEERTPEPAAVHQVAPGPRTVVLAGDSVDPEVGKAAAALAERAKWPLLAEPSSGACRSTSSIPVYRLILGSSLSEGIERVVTFGRPTLSRPVSRLLARRDVEHIVVSPEPEWFGAGVPNATIVQAVQLADAVAVPDADPGAGAVAGRTAHHGPDIDEEWCENWLAAGAAASAAVRKVAASDGDSLNNFAVADAVIGRPGQVYLGSSNVVRDVDLAMTSQSRATVMAGRGLSGIDGTVSTASGISLASSPVRVLLGDLTLLHDIGALLIGPLEQEPELQVVVVNDDGGGIFATLEHGEQRFAGVFERIFGTPHGRNFEEIAAGYGWDYARATTREELDRVLDAPRKGRSIIEVAVHRDSHRDFAARVRDAVEQRLTG